MKGKPRIDLSPEVHSLLLAEAARRRIRPNALVAMLIVEAASPEAKHLVGMNLEEKNHPLAEDAKLPFALSPLPTSEPLNSESLSSEEQSVLARLKAGESYRDIEKTNGISKTKVQMIAAKLQGMGLFQQTKKGRKRIK